MGSSQAARRLLYAILIVALAVRLWGITFGLPFAYARPDETEVAGPALGFLSGDLRPPFFQWPTFFSYTIALLYGIYGGWLGPMTGHASVAAFAESRRQHFAPFLYIPRGVSIVMGLVTIWAVFRLGRRLVCSEKGDGGDGHPPHDGQRAVDVARTADTVGLVAAWFLALAFLHVRDSHFGVTDITMTALVVLATLASAWWAESGGLGRAVLAGALAGLAGSTKYNGLGTGVSFLAAAAARLAGLRTAGRRDAAGDARQVLLACAAYGAALLVAFLGTSPYIVIDWTRFVRDVTSVQSTLALGHGMTVGRGWWYYASVVLPASIGWPMFLCGIAGAVTLAVTRPRSAAVVLAFPVGYYLYAGRGFAVFARYVLPIVPFLCVLAAWAVVSTVRWWTPRLSPPARTWLIAGAAVAIVTPTAWQSIQIDRLLATEDNRLVVARGLEDSVPIGSVICQTGAPYGRVPFAMDGRELPFTECEYEAQAQRFSTDTDWVLVQRSPLVLYSAVPEPLERELRELFVLVAAFPADTGASVDRAYDQQDAFYLPLRGFRGLTRPGPAFELYRRKPD